MASRRPWTADEVEYVRAHYQSTATAKIAKAIGRTVTMVYNRAFKLGLSKGPEFDASPESGRLKKGESRGWEFRFPKGNVPFNKGLRRPGWAPGRMRETQFKPGQMAGAAKAKWKPIGTITPDTEGYLRIKLRERKPGMEHGWNSNVWKLYHHQVWEQHNGPIPPKHIVAFKDKDRSNCAIENLELISMADNARRNSMWATLPRELAEVIQLQGALKRRLRKLNGKEHD